MRWDCPLLDINPVFPAAGKIIIIIIIIIIIFIFINIIYINEFEKHLHKVKNHGTQMPNDVLIYDFLKNANLKQSKEWLIKCTIRGLREGIMKKQLKKVFSDHSSPSCNTTNCQDSQYWDRETYQIDRNSSETETEDAFYTKDWYSIDRKQISSIPQTKKRSPQSFLYQKSKKSRSPTDSRGNINSCAICESVNHCVQLLWPRKQN